MEDLKKQKEEEKKKEAINDALNKKVAHPTTGLATHKRKNNRARSAQLFEKGPRIHGLPRPDRGGKKDG